MNATTLVRAALWALVSLAAVGCGGSSNHGGSADMARPASGGSDLAPPPCVMDPKSGSDILNACTSAQTGDPAKDYPYHPKLVPNGNLPPLN